MNLWLAKNGYNYTGLDIAPKALEEAKALFEFNNCNGTFVETDILADIPEPLSNFDAVFDKGCLHTFLQKEDQQRLIDQVHTLLKPGGFFISISGSKDHPDSEGDIETYGYPRLTASELIHLTEEQFYLHYLTRCIYGKTEGINSFLGWAMVLERR